MNVSDVIIKDVKSCHPNSSLQNIAITMWNKDCGSVLVIDEQNKLVSIVTDRDIAMAAALKNKALCDISASEVTGDHPVFTCNPSDDVHIALDIMQFNKIRRLPVITDEGELTGILSVGDVVGATALGDDADLSASDTINTLKSVFTHH
ncbi:CBS domain-containing protein [Gammaproteobacteria bacterium AH-315-C21]|nr:CBS domain-containing protein [Gammaproteobacteria bacterium AH-315-C21]